MKKILNVVLSMLLFISISLNSSAQSLLISGSVFFPLDSITFTYANPSFTSTDWIGIYKQGITPSVENPSIEKAYLKSAEGTSVFKTVLDPGLYIAYMFCCDGYTILSSCTFEIADPDIAFVTPTSLNFDSGPILKFNYNDPAFADGDWIAIFFDGDDPTLVPSITWSKLVSKSGVVSFPGVLIGGDYIAVLFCCGTTETEYARSVPFHVSEGAVGSFVKTAASVYPEGTYILVNFRDSDFNAKDRIAIYNEGAVPGVASTNKIEYVPGDSGTVEFSSLTAGDYTAYLLCCDGFTIKAQYNFKVVDASIASLVATAIVYANGEGLDFTFNSPSFTDTDWIGIYREGEIPGGEGIYSIWWKYLPEASGNMIFTYPDDYGQNVTDASLEPGRYYAGLFCCDAYGLYASVSFIVSEFGVGVKPLKITDNSMVLFPNPGNGIVSIKLAKTERIRNIDVYTITGQLVYQDKIDELLKEKTLDLKLGKGMYFIEVMTENSRMTRKIIIE